MRAYHLEVFNSDVIKFGEGADGEMGRAAGTTGTDVVEYNGYLYATRVYNAVWNDIADFRTIADTVSQKPGMCYAESGVSAIYCYKRCQKGVIGILTDTYGISAGAAPGKVPFAVAGWVLAYVDQIYEPGTCLTNDKIGVLTKMKWWEKILFPERIVGTYCGKEPEEFWGNEKNKVVVDGRHWVKVK